MKCSHKSITSGREIIFRCQFHKDAVENNFLRLGKSLLDVAYKGGFVKISECVRIASSGLVITSLLQVTNRLDAS